MYMDRNLLVDIAEEALNMRSIGSEDWCVLWYEWFWQQEIERAIGEIRQGRS